MINNGRETVVIHSGLDENRFEWYGYVARECGDVLYRTDTYDYRGQAEAECIEHCTTHGLLWRLAEQSGGPTRDAPTDYIALARDAMSQYEDERQTHGKYPTNTMQELLLRAQTYALLALAEQGRGK